MTRTTRWILGLVIGSVVLALATVGAGAAAIYHAGSVSVAVDDGDDSFHVRVPAGLVRAAIAVTPRSVLGEARHELEPFLEALDAGWREIDEAPDFVLAEIVSERDHVRIEKRGPHLLVAVDDGDTSVRVSIPLATVGALLQKLDV